MADKVYAVIDTNVIVSSLISKKAESYPFSVMAHVYSGVIIPVFNNEIINEYKDVLSREKFQQHRHNPPKISGLFFVTVFVTQWCWEHHKRISLNNYYYGPMQIPGCCPF